VGERIAAAFPDDRAAFMPYVMGGFPTMDVSREIGEACVANGADLMELGIPFSDPLADGPVIHAAGTHALRNGATVEGVLDVAEHLAPEVPVVVMTYANLVLARGAERFADDLARRGVAGLIVPDLPLEEADEVLAACDEAGVDLVPLVAPTTPDERLAQIGARARGFVYSVGVVGVTGERASVADSAKELLGRARVHTDVPVALGFGIGTPESAVEAADAGAQGVIVASRLIRATAEAGEAGAAKAVGELVRGFSDALRG
jgi:tryptophan synthase alpha chain